MIYAGTLWTITDDAGATPPAPAATDDRRRRWIGAAVLFLMVLG